MDFHGASYTALAMGLEWRFMRSLYWAQAAAMC